MNDAQSVDAACRILAVDDQPELLSALNRLLRRHGFVLEPFTRAEDALAALGADPEAFDAALVDVNMPRMSGLELLPRAKELAPELPVIILSADDSAATAVAALEAGAFTYLTKPLDDPEEIALALRQASALSALSRRNRDLERRLAASERFETLIGASEAMREVFATMDKVAAVDLSVLVRGESGTGKELAARAIHARSGRRRGPFVALNCGAIPEALIDSELFGHTRGAFTGAVDERPGVFVEADGGTLLLDEIGELPLPVQLRLLRVLQEGEVRSVGGTGTRAVDVRVIAATNIDLERAVADKRFRPDLFYRLEVVSLTMPPLRERGDDLLLLAAHFLDKHAHRQGRRGAVRLSPEAAAALTRYDWPGNVRELENAIQGALALASGELIEVDALPGRVLEGAQRPARSGGGGLLGDLSWTDSTGFREAKRRVQDAFERAYLCRLLDQVGGNVSEAARRAGLDRSNFRRLLGRHGIDPAASR